MPEDLLILRKQDPKVRGKSTAALVSYRSFLRFRELARALVSSVGELTKGDVLRASLLSVFGEMLSSVWEDGGVVAGRSCGFAPLEEQHAAFSPLHEGSLGWTVLRGNPPPSARLAGGLLFCAAAPPPFLCSFSRLWFHRHRTRLPEGCTDPALSPRRAGGARPCIAAERRSRCEAGWIGFATVHQPPSIESWKQRWPEACSV